jgi:hypothetical protein
MTCPLPTLLFHWKSQLTLFLFFLSVLTSHRSAGQCSVTSSLTGSSFSNNNSIGGSNSWSSASNVGLSDNNYADNGVLLGVLGTATTNYVVVKNFGLSLPSSASICGIEVTIERIATGISIIHTVKDNSIRLVKNNIITGDDWASGSNWPGSDESAVYGSVSETWGSSWTPADMNAANFGVAISAKFSGVLGLLMTAKIDRVTLKVFFNIVLPVQIMNVKAIQQEDKVKLEWATASENNSHHFTVERSADGATGWQPINTVAGAGNSNTNSYYQVTDPAPLSKNFYRLRQTDMNGFSTFSTVVALHFKKEKVDLLVYPNPVHDEITILFPGKAERIFLKNISGGYVVVKNISPIAGRGIKVKLPALQKGYYWLTIQTAQRSYIKKIMVL